MNRADFKGQSSISIQGKAFLIAVVIIFSSLSFTLGFLVGKNAREKKPEPVAQTTASVSVQPVQNLLPTQASPETPLQNVVVQSPEVERVADKKPADQSAEKKAADQSSTADKETVKEPPKEVRQETASPAADAVYTIQLGAMKSRTAADNLKAKYAKKGYKIYMITAKNKKHEKTYKIRIGEFSERKEAEILALKLQKNEGINTFVTTIR